MFYAAETSLGLRAVNGSQAAQRDHALERAIADAKVRSAEDHSDPVWLGLIVRRELAA